MSRESRTGRGAGAPQTDSGVERRTESAAVGARVPYRLHLLFVTEGLELASRRALFSKLQREVIGLDT
jgi:hypothetical protein